MNALRQLWRVACYEWFDALRSRRALVVLLLYMAAALANMYWSISFLHTIETKISDTVLISGPSRPGVVSTAIWQSDSYQRLIRGMIKDDEVYRDIRGRHPVELIYAWFAFFYTPLLVVLVAAARIAEELRSGAVRYIIFRTSRATWTLGKFTGQALMIGFALLLSALSAWLVAKLRLTGSSPPNLCLNMLQWTLRAWLYSFAYLGMIMGLSHLTKSPSKATIYGILAISACFVLSTIANHFSTDSGWRYWLPWFTALLPNDHKMLLWRSAPASLITGTTYLTTLGLCYLLTGYALFRKRDI